MENSLSFLRKQESRWCYFESRILDSRFHGNDILLDYNIFKKVKYYKLPITNHKSRETK
jgi:hypothetical protein